MAGYQSSIDVVEPLPSNVVSNEVSHFWGLRRSPSHQTMGRDVREGLFVSLGDPVRALQYISRYKVEPGRTFCHYHV